ncbi:MAG: 16S rRNA (guanine527-N7)-methyltransferase [Vicingaceae bacterium]|jgi:16S rRNA (guanine527-N7)-methyltransferase
MEEIICYFPHLSEMQRNQFEELKALYVAWNAQINVISRKDLEDFYVRHVLHSVAIAKVIEFKPGTKLLDVGTGGGFPSIPLAILFPEVSFLSVDSIGKKIKVVTSIAESLGLKNIEARHQRAETVDGQFDFVISRAVTRTVNFLPWVKDKIKKDSFNDVPNGYLFLKGGDLREELQEVQKKYTTFNIYDFFSNDFFETKKVIYMPK